MAADSAESGEKLARISCLISRWAFVERRFFEYDFLVEIYFLKNDERIMIRRMIVGPLELADLCSLSEPCY